MIEGIVNTDLILFEVHLELDASLTLGQLGQLVQGLTLLHWSAIGLTLERISELFAERSEDQDELLVELSPQIQRVEEGSFTIVATMASGIAKLVVGIVRDATEAVKNIAETKESIARRRLILKQTEQTELQIAQLQRELSELDRTATDLTDSIRPAIAEATRNAVGEMDNPVVERSVQDVLTVLTSSNVRAIEVSTPDEASKIEYRKAG